METSEKVPYRTKLYQSRKALGRCPTCGKPRDVPNRVNCSKCLAYGREFYARKASNMTIEEKVARSQKSSATQKIRRDKLRSEGRCATCGAPSPDRYYCEKCNARIKMYQAKGKKGGK